ncbi:hypothetical protein [Enterococcus wangshanyuanii]|uniref:Uncharacterized protein n=1 Tax=Enterococcus wangshanyuanii TaxID=2005703 RepID=A0ABQ1PR64_9ENTE|nr:hypothetical protein [Enterococcus wangshanyuanii]GGD01733.1 hypothetical protein GCM10011573_34070 [Enterococcus wangshanyuanii]
MKIYYAYFKNNQFREVKNTFFIRQVLGTDTDTLANGSQILTIGLNEEGMNATEFLIWSSNEKNLNSLLEKEVIKVLNSLSDFMESDIKKGVDETLKWLKENPLDSRELFI